MSASTLDRIAVALLGGVGCASFAYAAMDGREFMASNPFMCAFVVAAFLAPETDPSVSCSDYPAYAVKKILLDGNLISTAIGLELLALLVTVFVFIRIEGLKYRIEYDWYTLRCMQEMLMGPVQGSCYHLADSGPVDRMARVYSSVLEHHQ